jgi:transposase
MNSHKFSIGIDVSKHHLDVYSEAQKKNHRFDNTASGISCLQEFLQTHPPIWRIVLEPSGGYEQSVFSALVSKGYPVSLVPGQRVRSFAKALGLGAKTDWIDSQLLTYYGSTMNPKANASLNPLQEKLKSLIDRRSQILDMIKAEGNRLEKNPLEEIVQWIQEHLESLKQQLLKIEKSIKTILNEKHYQEIVKILISVPGVGVTTAATLLATLPELGKLSKKKISRMVGIAPLTRESGTFKGQAYISGG